MRIPHCPHVTRWICRMIPYVLIVPMLASAKEDSTASNITELQEQLDQMQVGFETMKRQYEAQLNKLREQVDELRTKTEGMRHEKKLDKEIDRYLRTRTDRPIIDRGAFGSRGFQTFNPDISVIGDFLGHVVEKEHGEAQSLNEDRFSIRELELAFSGSVDPYARADVFVHVHEHVHGGEREWHTGLCEAYLTLLTLPWDLQARAGKFRAPFGKAATLHTHAMPWVDRPNVTTNYFGPGAMSEEGVEVSWLVPNPWDQYIELTFDVQNNENPRSFAGNDGDDVIYLAHLKNFFDLSESTTLEVGVSGATGPNDERHGDHKTILEGVDLTLKWRPLRKGLYRSLTWQSEALWSQKDQDDPDRDHTEDSWGMYSSLEYQFAKRWKAFTRYDYSQFPDDDDATQEAGSVGMTFSQSEYCFWRLAYKRTDADGPKTIAGDDRHEVWLQLNFGLGPHRAHQY